MRVSPSAVLALLVFVVAASSATAAAAKPVAAIPVASAQNLTLEEVSSSLLPLTKVSCGNATVVVYGVEAGKPVVVVVYAEDKSWRLSMPACIERLRACLAVMGGEVEEKLLNLTGAAKTPVNVNAVNATVLTVNSRQEARNTTAPGQASRLGKARAEAVTASSTPEGVMERKTTSTAKSTLSVKAAPSSQTQQPSSQGGAQRVALVLAAGVAGAAVMAAWARRAATP